MDTSLTEAPAAPAPGTGPASVRTRDVSPGVRTGDGGVRTTRIGGGVEAVPAGVDLDAPLDPALVADLHAPNLVVSEDYVGSDRRAPGLVARLLRTTFPQRRSLLRLEIVIALAVASVGVLVATSVLFAGADTRTAPTDRSQRTGRVGESATASRTVTDRAPAAATPAAAAPTTTLPTPTTTVPPAPVAAPAAAPAVAPAAAPTPAQLGAEALTLVRYPWQRIPGYSIQFFPIADAPSPGFYGNTTFTWGQPGGTSDLYVYAGETVQTLAGITAFEIGHEVDAAAVEPQGGEAQIENILGIHPASWAPDCDCAEQGFLSGWYAAAFSDYWSPGVGNWSTVAPEPSGAVLAAVEPWLNPAIS